MCVCERESQRAREREKERERGREGGSNKVRMLYDTGSPVVAFSLLALLLSSPYLAVVAFPSLSSHFRCAFVSCVFNS